jgi:hypothetical protein
MYWLILLTCSGFYCEPIETIKSFKTLKECETVIELKFKEIEDNQGLICIKEIKDGFRI